MADDTPTSRIVGAYVTVPSGELPRVLEARKRLGSVLDLGPVGGLEAAGTSGTKCKLTQDKTDFECEDNE